jgi:uncharacterized protein (TIGR02646 family)
MRKINKLTPLDGFDGNKFKKDCSDWDCFHKKYKEDFEEARLQILTEEQNGLCGYTEIYINELEECHIDHYRKKSSSFFPTLVFDWNNFVVATKDEDFGATFKDNHYNNNGIQKDEYDEIYNPVDDNIPFEYTEWGAIKENGGKIEKTVEVFNLNIESLKTRRADIIRSIKSYKDLSDEEILIALETSGFLSVIEEELNKRKEV